MDDLNQSNSDKPTTDYLPPINPAAVNLAKKREARRRSTVSANGSPVSDSEGGSLGMLLKLAVVGISVSAVLAIFFGRSTPTNNPSPNRSIARMGINGYPANLEGSLAPSDNAPMNEEAANPIYVELYKRMARQGFSMSMIEVAFEAARLLRDRMNLPQP